MPDHDRNRGFLFLSDYGTTLPPSIPHRAAKIEVDTRVRRKLRTVLKIRPNTYGWNETQPLKKRSASEHRS
jgi:hypothetical protein